MYGASPITREHLIELYRQTLGLGESAATMASGAVAEPVAGLFGAYEAMRGGSAAGARDAVREGMTYAPRTQAGQGQLEQLGRMAQSAVNSAPVRTWQRGVDYAGRSSPVAGATLQTVPAALGALAGYKPSMQTGQAVSRALAQAQRAAMENAMQPRVLHPQRGVFAGINAKTADLTALDSARKMTASGVPADEVWLKTGWGVGADGKWRFEIDDSSAQLKMRQVSMDEMKNIHGGWIQKDDFLRRYEKTPEADAMRTMNSARSSRTSSMPTLDQVIGHDDLFAGYPELRSLLVHVDDKMPIGDAAYAPTENAISLSSMRNDQMKSVLKHEIQHAIQQREGFAAGGSPSEFLDSKTNDLLMRKMSAETRIAEINSRLKLAKGDEYINLLDERQSLIPDAQIDELDIFENAHKDYLRIPGEVEARNVQARAKMSAQERRATHPRKTADVAEKDQIR